MADSNANDNVPNPSGSQIEGTSGPPAPPGTPTVPPPISVAAARSVLGPSSSSPASVGQIRSSTQSRAPGLRPRPSQTFTAGARISSSPYRSDSIASPTFSDIYNASDGVASPYKSGRIRDRRQRPPIQPRSFDDILAPMESSAAAGIRDDQVESQYWDSETDGDLDEIPEGMMEGWNAGAGAGFNAAADVAAGETVQEEDDDDGENDETLLGGAEGEEGQEDAEMEDAPLGNGVAGEDEDTIVDDYLGDLSSEDEDEEVSMYSGEEDLPPRKRQKKGGDCAEKGEK